MGFIVGDYVRVSGNLMVHQDQNGLTKSVYHFAKVGSVGVVVDVYKHLGNDVCRVQFERVTSRLKQNIYCCDLEKVQNSSETLNGVVDDIVQDFLKEVNGK